jgi:hypothetical protein
MKIASTTTMITNGADTPNAFISPPMSSFIIFSVMVF